APGEGAGKRSADDRSRNETEDGANGRARGRGRQGAPGETVRGACAVNGARGESAGRRDAVHAAAEGEADSAEPSRGGSPQGGNREGRRGGCPGEGDRQQGGARETQFAVRGRRAARAPAG